MARTYRFYVSGYISDRLTQTIRQGFPVTFGSSSVFPFGGVVADPNDADYLIDKVLPINNFAKNPSESYCDIEFVDRPAGATEVTDEQWFETLVAAARELIVTNMVVYEDITIEE